jgi:polar amino acid transport system substrate-binding protein
MNSRPRPHDPYLPLLAFLLLFMAVAQSSNADELTPLPGQVVLAADPWCPHNCEAGSTVEGYMVDILRQAFALQDISVNYVNMSWARALQQARSHRVDGIIGVFAGDASDFLFPEEALGYSETMFFAHPDSHWTYEGLKSLENRTLLVISDYFYAPGISQYINNNRHQQDLVWELSGEQPLTRAITLIGQKRANLLFEDRQVMAWTLRKRPDLPKLRSSGNIYAAPVYAAFAPAHPHAQALARILSDGVRHLRATGELKRIYQSYGLGADGKARMVSPAGAPNNSSP